MVKNNYEFWEIKEQWLVEVFPSILLSPLLLLKGIQGCN